MAKMLFELMYRFLQEPPMSCSYSDIATAHFDSRAENYTLKPRNTRAEVFCKNGVLKNKIHRKTPVPESLFQ